MQCSRPCLTAGVTLSHCDALADLVLVAECNSGTWPATGNLACSSYIFSASLTWIAFLEDHLPRWQGVILHALRQVKELAVAQAEEDGHLAQRLEAPHILNWAQQAVKGLACQAVTNCLCLGCRSSCPAD